MASDAKVLEEDEETGAKRFKYVRTGEDHYSLAFTYAWMTAESGGGPRVRRIELPIPAKTAAAGRKGFGFGRYRHHQIDAGFLFGKRSKW